MFSYNAGMKGGSMVVYYVLYQLFAFTCTLADESRAEGQRANGDVYER